MVTVCGIDEAGKGPVIGPLVVCGILISRDKEDELARIGSRDSKVLTAGRREKLFNRIEATADNLRIEVLSPKQIDNAVFAKNSNLNQLETAAIAKIINRLKPDIVYIDCPSNNIEGWVKQLEAMLDHDPRQMF